jgi:cytochrome c-type biogenesis protein CcmH/NrfF
MLTVALQNSSSSVITHVQQQLVGRLEHEMVAPCCYSQIVADHMSDAAAQMREEIVQMVLSGRSEQQILAIYKARYGEVILAAPDGMAGAIAYTVPPLCGLLACGLVAILLYRWRNLRDRTTASVPYSASTIAGNKKVLDRIRAEVGEL